MTQEEQILAYLQNELSDDERSAFEQQLLTNPSLQTEVDAMKADLLLLEIEDYLEGKLSTEQTKVFEARLEEDEQFRKEVERQKKLDFLVLGAEVADKIPQKQDKQSPVSTPSIKRKLPWRVILSAAAVILIIGFLAIRTQVQKRYMPMAIAEARFEPSLDATNLKGQTFENNPLFEGLATQIQSQFPGPYTPELIQNLQDAIYSLEGSDSLQAELQYCLANIYLANKTYPEATKLFEQLQSKVHLFEEAGFSDKLTWHLALATLAIGNEDQARSLLERLNKADKYYQERAKQVLKDLDSFWRKI